MKNAFAQALKVFFLTGTAALVIAALASCSASYELALSPGGTADASFSISIDADALNILAQKSAAFSGEEATVEIQGLDTEAMKKAVSQRRDLSLLSIEKTSDTAAKGKLRIPDITKLGAGDSGISPFFTRKEDKGLVSLAFRLDRKNAPNIMGLLPGIDMDIAEILAPPALYGDELSVEEYKESLTPFLGKKGVQSLEKAKLDLKISAPSTITSVAGGKAEGRIFTTSIPLLKAMVLEEPISFSLSWKNTP